MCRKVGDGRETVKHPGRRFPRGPALPHIPDLTSHPSTRPTTERWDSLRVTEIVTSHIEALHLTNIILRVAVSPLAVSR
jgi:hypothetical protein